VGPFSRKDIVALRPHAFPRSAAKIGSLRFLRTKLYTSQLEDEAYRVQALHRSLSPPPPSPRGRSPPPLAFLALSTYRVRLIPGLTSFADSASQVPISFPPFAELFVLFHLLSLADLPDGRALQLFVSFGRMFLLWAPAYPNKSHVVC